MTIKYLPSDKTPIGTWPVLDDFKWMDRDSNDFDYENRWKIQEEAKKVYGFVWPLAKENLQLIAKYSPLVEVGAGTGVVAKTLKNIGVDVVATDGYNVGMYPFKVATFCEIENIAAIDAVKKYSRNVLMCWTCYDEDWAFKALQHIIGHLIYIGEGAGGCCANDAFFNLLETDFYLVEKQDKPQRYGLHDYISVYKRKV